MHQIVLVILFPALLAFQIPGSKALNEISGYVEAVCISGVLIRMVSSRHSFVLPFFGEDGEKNELTVFVTQDAKVFSSS